MKRKSAVLALAVVVLSVTAVQAVPTTYVYTGNPFTTVSGPYTTSDFVTAMVTLASPLPPNTQLFTEWIPLAFSFSDGVQTITNLNANRSGFFFATGPTGMITEWGVFAVIDPTAFISTQTDLEGFGAQDAASNTSSIFSSARNGNAPGTWTTVGSVADTGSTLSLMTLTLMTLGVAARQFKRAPA